MAPLSAVAAAQRKEAVTSAMPHVHRSSQTEAGVDPAELLLMVQRTAALEVGRVAAGTLGVVRQDKIVAGKRSLDHLDRVAVGKLDSGRLDKLTADKPAEDMRLGVDSETPEVVEAVDMSSLLRQEQCIDAAHIQLQAVDSLMPEMEVSNQEGEGGTS